MMDSPGRGSRRNGRGLGSRAYDGKLRNEKRGGTLRFLFLLT